MSRAHLVRPAASDTGTRRVVDPPPGAGHIIEPMLSIDDLATILKCSRRLVERLRSAGKVPKPDFHVGRCPRWKAETVRLWIARGGKA
jgi:hypothetical protein